jgi:hypothetical protein
MRRERTDTLRVIDPIQYSTWEPSELLHLTLFPGSSMCECDVGDVSVHHQEVRIE